MQFALGALAAAAITALAGCAYTQATPPVDAATAITIRLPLTQAFGPDYPAVAPDGRPVRIDRAELSHDQRTLTVQFVGGEGYLASDACSSDYVPWLAARADELDVAVVAVRHEQQATLPPNTSCRLVGFSHTFHLALPNPFAGTRVNDVTGGIFFVFGPQDLATIVDLPDGWSQVRTFQQEPGPPPIWVQVFAIGDVAKDAPDEGPGHVVLFQAFGESAEWTDTRAEKARERGATSSPVTVNGEERPLWSDAASGELLLAWKLAERSLGLVGNSADMTADELVDVAQSVAVPVR